ncbi:hypothetical protein E2C01_016939 [Portunus trituberculatus]|uniref:Uncharacterized protein n=1 Tax=Portunus trituberculatus TaxID=210409 RepID=A0A5B7DQE1_PORTR|nr:hypothetical protein [Portunus trituberculatus]
MSGGSVADHADGQEWTGGFCVLTGEGRVTGLLSRPTEANREKAREDKHSGLPWGDRQPRCNQKSVTAMF